MMDFVSWDDSIPNCFWKVMSSSHGNQSPPSRKALKKSWVSNCQPRGFSLPEGSQLHDFFEYRCRLGFTYFIKTYQNRDLRFLKPTMIR